MLIFIGSRTRVVYFVSCCVSVANLCRLYQCIPLITVLWSHGAFCISKSTPKKRNTPKILATHIKISATQIVELTEQMNIGTKQQWITPRKSFKLVTKYKVCSFFLRNIDQNRRLQQVIQGTRMGDQSDHLTWSMISDMTASMSNAFIGANGRFMSCI